jgi:hypothetical protein
MGVITRTVLTCQAIPAGHESTNTHIAVYVRRANAAERLQNAAGCCKVLHN